MKTKFIGALVIGSALLMAAVLWRVDSFVSLDRQGWVESQTRNQVSAINYALATELRSLQRVVASLSSDTSIRERIPWSSLQPYFGMATFIARGQSYEIQNFVARDGSKASTWSPDFVRASLGTFPEASGQIRYFVKPFQDAQRNRYVGVVIFEGQRAYAVFGGGEAFQAVVDSQRSSFSQTTVVTDGGLTVGHLTPEYLGTVLKGDPLFESYQAQRSTLGTLNYDNKTGSFFGLYEKIPQTNLLVLANASLTAVQKGKTSLLIQLALLGLGIAIVGVAVALWLLNPVMQQQDNLAAEVNALKFKNNQLANSPAPIANVNEADLQKQKVEAASRVASSLAHEMRGPLASILGFSQMIIAKSTDSEIEQSAQSVVREARAARTVLDKLLGYAGEELKEKNNTKLEGPVAVALKQLEGVFKQKGIKITQNLQATTPLFIETEAMARAIGNILQNSIEAMERMADKEITVDLQEDSEGVHLTISDKGEGIDEQNKAKIFDPFFTTRSFARHMGLGLSYSFGVFKEHNGEVAVESKRGEGTKVKITLRPTGSAQVLKVKKEEVPVIATEVIQLAENSEHREQAQVEFDQTQSELKNESPLDVNIESLLDLPEASEVKDLKAAPKKPAIKGTDEFVFRDGFLGDESEASEETSVAAQSATPSSAPTEQELESMNDELTPVDFITPPKLAARPAKKSNLDNYHVEIRRPGKRI